MPAARARFGDALPFLLKVLAADEPLSLQAHPSAEQAAEGYLREERLGIPVNSPVRNYRDSSHKPELLVALHQFEALAGFRPAAQTIELLRALAVSDLDPFIDLLNDQSDADGLRALFTTWITAPQPDIDVLVSAVLDGAINYVSSGATEFAAEAKTVLELGERYPGDAGVLAALLLNRITLGARRGDLLVGRKPARLFARCRAGGNGQLRQRVTRWPDSQARRRSRAAASPEFQPDHRVRSCARRHIRTVWRLIYDTPTAEFAASMLTLGDDQVGHEVDAPSRHDGPQILLCIEGSTAVHGKSGTLTLTRGAACLGGRRRRSDPAGRAEADEDLPGHRRAVIRCGERLTDQRAASAPRRSGRAARRSASHSRMLCRIVRPTRPRRRDHVQAVQQRESAQKPFGENGIGLRRAEELVEQAAHRPVPPGPPARSRGGIRESPIAVIIHTG